MSNYIFQRNGGPLLKWGGGLGRPPAPHVAGETRQLSGYVATGSYEAVGRRAGTPEILTGLGSISSGISWLLLFGVIGAAVVIADKVMAKPRMKSNPARRRAKKRRGGKRRRGARVRHARRAGGGGPYKVNLRYADGSTSRARPTFATKSEAHAFIAEKKAKPIRDGNNYYIVTSGSVVKAPRGAVAGQWS